MKLSYLKILLPLFIISIVAGIGVKVLRWDFFITADAAFNKKTTKLAAIPKKYWQQDSGRGLFAGASLLLSDVIFGKNGKTVVYVIKQNKKQFVVIGDKEGKHYDRIEDLVMSPNDKKIAYVAKEGSEEFIVLGDKEIKNGYKSVFRPAFSPNGKILAYNILEDGLAGIVAGDKKITPPPNTRIEPSSLFIFNPKKNEIAYIVKTMDEDLIIEKGPGNFVAIADLKQGTSKIVGDLYDNISNLTFSPDGKKLAYITSEGDYLTGKISIVVDGQAIVQFDYSETNKIYISSILFNPDNKSVAYVVTQNLKEHVVYGDKEGKVYDRISHLVFSKNGKKLAYVGTMVKGSPDVIVINGKEFKTYTPQSLFGSDIIDFSLNVRNLVFSPDNNTFAYALGGYGLSYVVVGKERIDDNKFYTDVSPPVFSPDGKYIGFGVQINGKNDEDELWWKAEKVR